MTSTDSRSTGRMSNSRMLSRVARAIERCSKLCSLGESSSPMSTSPPSSSTTRALKRVAVRSVAMDESLRRWRGPRAPSDVRRIWIAPASTLYPCPARTAVTSPTRSWDGRSGMTRTRTALILLSSSSTRARLTPRSSEIELSRRRAAPSASYKKYSSQAPLKKHRHEWRFPPDR